MAPSLESLAAPISSPLKGHTNDTTIPTTPAQSPDSALPKVSDLDSKAYLSQDSLLADIIESLRVSGGCVVRNLVAPDVLKEIEGEVRPHLDKAEPWNGRLCPFLGGGGGLDAWMDGMGPSLTRLCLLFGCGVRVSLVL